MTVITQSFVEEINEVTIASSRNIDGKIYDNLTRRNALFNWMDKKGKIKQLDGGTVIQKNMRFADGLPPIRYNGYEEYPIRTTENLAAAIYPWLQYVRPVTMSGREILENSGKERIYNRWAEKIDSSVAELTNDIAFDMYSDGSEANQIGGLRLLVADDPTTGVIGGVNAATNIQWRNISVGATTLLDESNVESYMDQVISQLILKGTGGPDVIIADATLYYLLKRRLTNIQRIDTSRVGDLGFTTIEFQGIPVVYDGGFQGFENDGTPIGGAPTQHMYFLNTDYLTLEVMRDFVFGPVKMTPGQDAISMDIFWAGNMTCAGRRFQGVLWQDTVT